MTSADSTSDDDANQPTVLIIEDERALADLFAHWVSESYVVTTAYTGEAAFAALDDTIDVMLLDRRMPGVSGDEVLAHVRENEMDVQVAIISAVTPGTDDVELGFDEYLIKPVDRDDIHGVIERMLAVREYPETVQHLYRLTAARSALEAGNSPADLRGSEAYEELLLRIREVRENVDPRFAEITARGNTSEDYPRDASAGPSSTNRSSE